MMCEWVLQISCAFQGFQAALLKRPGPEEMAQLKTLVTDDICRDQTDSVLPPIPQIVWRAQGEYLHGWMSFPYKPLTLQATQLIRVPSFNNLLRQRCSTFIPIPPPVFSALVNL